MRSFTLSEFNILKKEDKMKRGFTLVELMMVVIIIGILATFAIPQYLKAVERVKGAKARYTLALISQAEKMYRPEHDAYITVNDGEFNTAFSSYIELAEVDVDPDWDYAVIGTQDAFIVTATRSSGTNIDETISLNQNGVWDVAFTP